MSPDVGDIAYKNSLIEYSYSFICEKLTDYNLGLHVLKWDDGEKVKQG